jgi:hypothetical protein
MTGNFISDPLTSNCLVILSFLSLPKDLGYIVNHFN